MVLTQDPRFDGGLQSTPQSSTNHPSALFESFHMFRDRIINTESCPSSIAAHDPCKRDIVNKERAIWRNEFHRLIEWTTTMRDENGMHGMLLMALHSNRRGGISRIPSTAYITSVVIYLQYRCMSYARLCSPGSRSCINCIDCIIVDISSFSNHHKCMSI